MTELKPAAYLQLDIHGKEMVNIEPDTSGYEEKPLYTKEQLQPKLKLTKSEFDEFVSLWERHFGVGAAFNQLYESLYSGKYMALSKNIWNISNTGIDNKHDERAIAFAYAYSNYEPEHPEKTIKIIPEKKWFVAVIHPTVHAGWTYLSVDGIKRISYDAPKSEAKQFDTKEEAEEWTNPLAKAVLLPIEGE